MYLLTAFSILLLVICSASSDNDNLENTHWTSGYDIEGKVMMPKDPSIPKNWLSDTRILVNYGQYVSFIREDGHFTVSNVPPGSYIVEVANKDVLFEPYRVDITSKGKIRGRSLNLLLPSSVNAVPYPLKMMGRQPTNYFRKRDEWRVTDMLMNPMVIMMVLPLLLIMVLPKLMNQDPELKKEMESLSMPKYDMPEMAELFTSWFGGPQKQKKKAIKDKKT